MVLEHLINPVKAEKTPWNMFLVGFVYSTMAILLSIWVFEAYASLVMVFLTVMACTYLVHSVLKLEEKKDTEIKGEKNLLREHSKAISVFVFLFLGFTASFAVWYVALPSDKLHTVFASQIGTISEVNKATSGFFFASDDESILALADGTVAGEQLSGAAISNGAAFTKIFFNNLKVLFFCILFAFFYGAGVVFILVWNASVIGVAIGNFVRSSIASITSSIGFTNMSHYFTSFSLGIATYMTHGIFEIIAYFTAALAAGIISIAVINHEYKSEKFVAILTDALDLFVISVVILLFAAAVEVYVTPALF